MPELNGPPSSTTFSKEKTIVDSLKICFERGFGAWMTQNSLSVSSFVSQGYLLELFRPLDF